MEQGATDSGAPELAVPPTMCVPKSMAEMGELLEKGVLHNVDSQECAERVDESTVDTFAEVWRAHSFFNAGLNYKPIEGSSGYDELIKLKPRSPSDPNNLMNLPGVRALQGCFEGTPVVIVGAGPSLEKNIQYLEKAQKAGFAILCCDNALKTVMRHTNVVPDLVLFLDAQEEVRKFFEAEADHKAAFRRQAIDTSNIPAVFFVGTHPAVLDAWKSPKKFMFHQHVGGELAERLQITKTMGDLHGYLLPGTCVQSVGVSLAMITKTPAMIFVGIDLAFTATEKQPNGQYYAFRDEPGTINILVADIYGKPVGTMMPFKRSEDWMRWCMRLRACNDECQAKGRYNHNMQLMARFGFGKRRPDNGLVDPMMASEELIYCGRLCDGCPQQKTYVNSTEGGIVGAGLRGRNIGKFTWNERQANIFEDYMCGKDVSGWIEQDADPIEEPVYKYDSDSHSWSMSNETKQDQPWRDWCSIQGRPYENLKQNIEFQRIMEYRQVQLEALEVLDINYAHWNETVAIKLCELRIDQAGDAIAPNVRMWPFKEAIENCQRQPWFKGNDIRRKLANTDRPLKKKKKDRYEFALAKTIGSVGREIEGAYQVGLHAIRGNLKFNQVVS